MKLLAPLSQVEEVEPLIRSGAEELYCGFVPNVWLEQNGVSEWLNRRNPQSANLHGLGDLAEVVQRAAQHHVPVFLTLNAHHYAPGQIPLLVELASKVAEVGVEALIVADLSLIMAIREAAIPIRLHLSSLATCTNAEAAALYHDLGVDRIVLPRHLSQREIRQIVTSGVPVEFEAFLMNDGCAFEEGMCLTSHHFGPICLTPWQMEVKTLTGAPADLADRWEVNLASYRKFQWALNNGGCSVNHKGLPNGPCGLCALPGMQEMGMTSLKIVGREASPMRKMASVQLARAVLNQVRAGQPAQAVADKAKQLRDTPELCASTYMCYYR